MLMTQQNKGSPTILGIDPGPTRSGWVYGNPLDKVKPVTQFGHALNEELLRDLLAGRWLEAGDMVIEEFRSFGRRIGQDAIWTIRWTGRFEQVIHFTYGGYPAMMPRNEAALVLCRSHAASNADMRQALMDYYGPGRPKAVGLKKKPGPLYGLGDHERSALAVGLAFVRKRAFEKAQGKLFDVEP